MNYIIIDLT